MNQSVLNLTDAMQDWLRDGGLFPAKITVFLEGTSYEYEVLERDVHGRVPQVAQRRGHKGFVLKVRSLANNRVYAAKISTLEDYTDAKLREELVLASQIEDDAPIVVHDVVGRVRPFDTQPEASKEWLCFISKWIDGESLEQIIAKQPEVLTPEVSIAVLKTLLTAILYLERKKLKHDDLHLGNIMVSKVSADVLASDPSAFEYQIKVIDIGSMKRLDAPTRKIDDDWASYAKCIAKIHNTLHLDRAIAGRYPRFLKLLVEFAQRLSEEDPARQFIDSQSLNEPLDNARKVLQGFDALNNTDGLSSPFEAISAEHLASDSMLLKLFEDNMAWLEQTNDKTPIVLTGPRGCGKSMVFRYLAFRTHLASSETAAAVFSKLKFFGIYVGCASDLQNDLLWIQREKDRAKLLSSDIVTFFNLVISRELFRTLGMAMKVPGVSEKLGITRESISSLISQACNNLGMPGEYHSINGINPAQALADELDKSRVRMARSMLRGNAPDITLPTTFIRDLCRTVVKHIPGLADFPIVFLLDDFTQQRLGTEVQSILNPILWQRDSTYYFKISCEPFGFSTQHIDGAKIDQSREYIPVNTAAYMQSGKPADVAQRRRFVQGLIDKRLQEAKYLGRVDVLIGASDYKEDPDLAIAIRNSTLGKKTYYNGLEVLANAWSSDVATVLFMVREMFIRATVDEKTEVRIPNHHQHDAIVHVSKQLVERVGYCHPYGSEMRRTLNAFGGLVNRLLNYGDLQKDGPDDPSVPQRRYRIEVTLEGEGDVYDQLDELTASDHAALLLKELIRRSIFIEMSESRAKEGSDKRTFRIQLKSSLLPNFGASLARKNYLPVQNLKEFSYLLGDPDQFADRLWEQIGKPLRVVPTTGDLFKNQRPMK